MRRTARFDATGRYRYSLVRAWEPGGARIAFVMLNPSTADARVDDPTIRRCIGFARDWGYGSMEAVNLFAFRATRPAALFRARDPVGPANDAAIARAAGRARAVVLAWGHHGARLGRAEAVLRIVARSATLLHLGCTRAGAPRHPLYLPRGTRPVPWTGTIEPLRA